MTKSPTHVPRLVPYDDSYRERVLVLARELHAESKFHSRIPLDEDKSIAQLKAASQLDNYYFRLCVRGDDVLGGFLGHLSTVFFSQELVAKDLSWFVHRNRRGSVAAVMLLADFERWGRERGAKQFMLGQATGVNIETTTALYEHLGYEVIGVNTAKRA